MVSEAVEAVEAVIWGAIVSFAVIAALTAFLIAAAGYWAGVLAAWTWRRITRPDGPRPEPHPVDDDGLDDDGLYAHWNAWTANPRKEKP